MRINNLGLKKDIEQAAKEQNLSQIFRILGYALDNISRDLFAEAECYPEKQDLFLLAKKAGDFLCACKDQAMSAETRNQDI
jgi:hypothetical protein